MKLYFILFLYLIMDFIWITTNFKLYNNSVIAIQKKPIDFRMFPAVIAYALLIVNIMFVLIPLTKQLSKIQRIIIFCISGLVIYGVYNATTYAIVENYPLNVALIDTIWGLTSHCILSIVLNKFYFL